MNSRSTYPRLGDKFHSLTFSAGIFSYVYHCALKIQKFFKYFLQGRPYPFYTAFGEASGKGGAFYVARVLRFWVLEMGL
jgi:hypothetical protein